MSIPKILTLLGLGLLCLLCIGVVYEQAKQQSLESTKPGHNEFCLINNKPIHYIKKGTGGPTAVFQSGLGSDYKIWQQVQDSISKFTTTISYDRAGLLWSEADNNPKTLESINSELVALLEKTNCPKPYIVVGHSLAGITLRPFIEQSGKDVVGIVFVDVAHPQQLNRASEELKKFIATPPQWLVSTAVQTGALRLMYSTKGFVSDLPADHWYNIHVKDYFYKSYKTVLQEAREDDVMFEQSESINSFGNTPLTIITGEYPNGVDFTSDKSLQDEYLSLHQANQKELLNLSSQSKQVMATKSSHYIPIQEPEIVINAIKQFLPPYNVMDYRKVKLVLDTLNAKRREEIDSTGTFTIQYTELTHGKKHLIFFGTNHVRYVDHPQFQVLAKVFREMSPQIAFNEGGEIPKSQKYKSITDGILRNGETGLLKYLSDSIGIDMKDGDMDTRSEFKELLKTIPQDQVYLYMAIERFLNGYRDGYFGKKSIEKSFQDDFISYLEENGFPVTDEERNFDHVKDLYKKYFGEELVLNNLLPVHDYYLIDDGIFGDVGRRTKVVRDEALLSKIDSALYKYDRVFVVFGGSHRIAVEPALKEIIRKH